MPWFRPHGAEVDAAPSVGGSLTPEEVRGAVEDVIRPANFFARGAETFEWEHAAEEVFWEVFQGRLLDPSHTRQRQAFETWRLFRTVPREARPAEPLLSLKLDREARQLHVTRAVYCHAWEGYHAGDNVYLSRETRKWVRELVGTVFLDQFRTADELRDELVCRLFQAVVGTSRLPLTSVEAPLPGFSLGELAYFHCPAGGREAPAGARKTWRELIGSSLHGGLAWVEKAKLLEVVLRRVGPDEVGPAADLFVARWQDLGHTRADHLALLRTVFNEVALSPWTAFGDRALEFVARLSAVGYFRPADHADFLGYLLRTLARHLTAYDLVTFHHRGANYPDALLLDAACKAYLELAERYPDLFRPVDGGPAADEQERRLRRRALRQGWLLRRFHEGLPVPDSPTSPGENARILPPPHTRVPEEQIFDPARRSRKLFAGDPLTAYLGEHTRDLLRQSMQDLQHPRELRELGLAVFVDRPLGAGKMPGEPDQTLLLSHEAFSRSVAEGRLRRLAEQPDLLPDPPEVEPILRALAGLKVEGIGAPPAGSRPRPDTVSAADARKAAGDFLFLRTTGQAARDFFRLFDLAPLARRFSLDDLGPDRPVLILRGERLGRGAEDLLVIRDGSLCPRLELRIRFEDGYHSRGGWEYPAAGLQVLRVWEPASGGEWREHLLEAENLVMAPRL